MKKFDLSAIMRKAWKLYRKGVAAFSECLHRAWNSAKAEPINAQRIEEAQQAAGVAEPVNTMGRLESRRVHGRAWRKSSVSGGAYADAAEPHGLCKDAQGHRVDAAVCRPPVRRHAVTVLTA